MHHAPEPVAAKLRHMEEPKVMAEQDRDFRGNDCDYHDDDQWNGGKPREQANDYERAADDFDDADERAHQVRIRDSDIAKATGAENLREEQLLDTLRKKDDRADQQSDQDCPAGCTSA